MTLAACDIQLFCQPNMESEIDGIGLEGTEYSPGVSNMIPLMIAGRFPMPLEYDIVFAT